MTPAEREDMVAAVTERVCAQLTPLFEQAAHNLERALEHTVVRFEMRLNELEANIRGLVHSHRNINKRLTLTEELTAGAGSE